MKGRIKITPYDKNATTWHSTHPSPWAPNSQHPALWIYFSVASSNNTNSEKQVTVVTSAVHSHRPHVHPTMAMSGLHQYSKGTVGMSALAQMPPEVLIQDKHTKTSAGDESA